MTEWKQFRNPDWSQVQARLQSPVIYDGRNLFDPSDLRQKGFEYHGIGRRKA